MQAIIRQNQRLTNIVSELTVRTQLGQIIRRATQKQERFVMNRRGEPTVVIMSVKDYVNTIAPAPQWLADIQAASKRRGTNRLTMRQIDAEIATARRDQKKKAKRAAR